ncbi:sugar ABC transporter ATP-binding protein [Mucilaginibacter sabulilitoris]|uniref:Sugar ABC transporter ATP-binding protein n=1 Tax=Mucilaginibacter sabulilitoris TaxID=1173583 RepID=A0ABZ0TKA4_9SPHI|nr:sugar ABC transporter ATP-binding protein [Mucilaginibacter sabulilitoris]WPU93599.1 sugar ABC transporter ATP-binding protein [Mucilaginibacter sabulilitoris]
MPTENNPAWRLELNNISKQFPGVKALDGVDFNLRTGEVHALCGENGAGKSTLMNILSGNLQPDAGFININGERIRFDNPQSAFNADVAIVYQHLSLVDSMSVAENIFANQQPHSTAGIIDFKLLYQNTSRLLQQLYIDINPKTLVCRLSPAQKQMIEIAKALSRNPQILICDEPTASLTEKETIVLFDIINGLKEKKVSVIYISHRLSEIFRIADRVTVLKDGKIQATFDNNDLTEDKLIRTMVGREIKQIRKQSSVTKQILMQVKNLSGSKFSDITFDLYCGEILGIAGLVGAGRTEIARAIFGADDKSGEVLIRDKKVDIQHPSDAVAKGIAYVPEDRKQSGLFLEMPVADNIGCLSAGTRSASWFNRNIVIQRAKEYVERLHITPRNINQKAVNLSGGNQQKVVLAKWLQTNPEVLIIDEPTHGIDVGAKLEIYELLTTIAAQGKGIIMISSDMPELLGLCDRILVLRRGGIAGQLNAAEASEDKIMLLAS